jgi:hypothetical protein
VAEIGWIKKMQEFTPRQSSPPEPPAGHWPSDEDLAAYIDGNLDKAESKRIVEHLATCEDCYAVYIGAVRFKLETEPAPMDNVVPFPSREEKRRWWQLSAMAAAAVLLVAVGSGGYHLIGPLPALLTAQVTKPIQEKPELPAGSFWLGPTQRGVGDTEEAPSEPASFKMGVQLVNLQVSLAANQGDQAQDFVARILQNLKTQNFVDESNNGYTGITGAIANGIPPKNLRGEASKLAGQAREIFDPLYLDLGQWVEAGRLAAISHNPDFFRQFDNQTFLRRALWRDRLGFKDSQLPQGSRKELEAVQQILGKGDLQSADYDTLRGHLEEILKANYPQ